MGGVNQFTEIDAVTIDGHGTLLALADPIPALLALLPEHSPASIEAAFRGEVDYYVAHSAEGRDEASLSRLRDACTSVFNDALGAGLTTEQYIGALEFELLPGVHETLAALRARGLALAVVANWDFSLHEHLGRHALRRWFDTVVTSAEAGVKKPEPEPFRVALERLGVEPHRAVHVGDHPAHDEVGARGVGMRFLPAPLATAFSAWG